MKKMTIVLTLLTLSFFFLENTQASLHKVGIWAGAASIQENFYVSPLVEKIFNQNAKLRANMPAELPADFKPLIDDIHRYIESTSLRSSEANNGILNSELSRRIVKASFCFGLDPKMVAAKIHMESVFNHGAVSHTGAIGLSQMTFVGMEEVNDQLGNRGPKNAPAANTTYFEAAVACYSEKSFVPMWGAGGPIKKGQSVTTLASGAIKKWLLSNVDRDLLYGQILLKVNLAATKAGRKSVLDNYSKALIRYNGETQIVNGIPQQNRYATKVLNYFKAIEFEVEELTPDKADEIPLWLQAPDSIVFES